MKKPLTQAPRGTLPSAMLFLVLPLLTLVGCQNDGLGDDTGKAIDEVIEEVGDEIDDATDDDN